MVGINTNEFPVEQVSWEDAAEFCRRLTARSDETRFARQYRLPTEAEWEYACRGGACSYSPFHFGRVLNGTQANCRGNIPYGTDEIGPYLERTCAVGNYVANVFGLHDMHGNVWEWCSNIYTEGMGPYRVIRGGSLRVGASTCRSAKRDGFRSSRRSNYLGFRVASVPSR